MPTGYTVNIKDGITFEQFTMGCARAFGALVLMRDEPNDAPIPEKLEPNDYHERMLIENKEELKRIEVIGIDKASQLALDEWRESEKSRIKRLNENKELRVKYQEMLDKALAWIPPTDDHKGLLKFMVDQLEKSIEFDCSEEYYSKPTELLSGDDWLEQQKTKVKHSIEYHEKENKAEIERTNSRNSWLKNLRDSLAT